MSDDAREIQYDDREPQVTYGSGELPLVDNHRGWELQVFTTSGWLACNEKPMQKEEEARTTLRDLQRRFPNVKYRFRESRARAAP